MTQRRYILTGILFILFALPIVAQNSNRAQAATITWEEEPQFHVEVNGKLDLSAKIYRPDDNRPVLIYRSDNFSTPLLLDLSRKTIETFSLKQLSERDEYSYTSSKLPNGKKVGNYTMKGGASAFSYKGKKVTIRVKETLVGDVSEGVILAHSPEYKALRDRYNPKKSYIKKIKAAKKKVDVVVLFATWCPTCKKILPEFMKIVDLAGKDLFNVTYIGIAMGGNEPAEAIEKYGHESPAFIFYSGGKELDRINGEPTVPMEQRVAEILTR